MKVLTLFLVLFFWFVAHSQEATPAPEPTTQTSSSVQEPQYVYDSTNKKDPFKPYRAPRIRGGNQPAIQVDPLTILDVQQLELVAIMWGVAKPSAVVKDAGNRTFTIYKDSRIGRNEGVVVDIREGEVVIVEKFDDGLGNVIREHRVLEMAVKVDNQKPGG